MKIGEYNKRRAELQAKCNKAIAELSKEYALNNNTIEIGDVISSRTVTIRVDTITPAGTAYRPHCEYSGHVLPKNGKRWCIGQPYIIDK